MNHVKINSNPVKFILSNLQILWRAWKTLESHHSFLCRERTSWPAHQPHAPNSPHTPVKNLDLDFSITDLSMYLSQLRSSHWRVGCNTCLYLEVWLNLVRMCFMMTEMSLTLVLLWFSHELEKAFMDPSCTSPPIPCPACRWSPSCGRHLGKSKKNK